MITIPSMNHKIKKRFIVLFLLFLLTNLLTGCITEEKSSHSSEDTLEKPLNQIALTIEEVNFTSIQYSNYTDTPYAIQNLTGNNIVWNKEYQYNLNIVWK
jgi:hypothetical protein